ncbi:hypothetical protein E2C01_059160 [Portunus trituberculatus]|uniref:Uncharacterized protein n=1 Tax=Portunus trituberculatus TaxID=210409 RepID=A0A5B7H526_PORTR|nr:hypothetical protein [Portunus trituberculatus]
MVIRNGEGREWGVRKWKSEIDRVVKHVKLSDWKNKIEQKSTLEWYGEKEAPIKDTVYGSECKELQMV